MTSRIDEILKDTQDFWAQSARRPYIFCHSIYMIGREKEKSKPVILLCCESASRRIKARNVVKANLNMSEYSAFRFGHAPVPPGPTTPLRLASGRGAVGRSHPDGGISKKVFLKRPMQALCGIQVIIAGDGKEGHWVEATVSGVRSLKGKCFGLSVAHGLFEDRLYPEEMETKEDWCVEYDSIDDKNTFGTCELFHQVSATSRSFQLPMRIN